MAWVDVVREQPKQGKWVDVESAKPKEPTYFEKAGSQVMPELKGYAGLISKIINPIKTGYDIGKDIAKTYEENQSVMQPNRGISSLFQKGLVEPAKEMGPAMVKPYIHPIKSFEEAPVSTALAYTPLLGRKLFGGAGKVAKLEPVSELIGGKLERSTVENTATNPFVRKNISMFAKEDINDVVNNAAESTLNARTKIQNAQNYIYTKHGITDDMQVPLGDTLKNISDEVNKFGKGAIGENKKIASQAKRLVVDLKMQASNNVANFGTLKSLTRQIYDLAESNVTESGKYTEAGRLYNKIGAELTKSKKSILPIKEASEQYSALQEVDDILRETLRLDRINGEQTLPMKILRRFKDAEHGQFKKSLNEINDIIKKHSDLLKENPQTADLINEYGNAGFVDKIKLTQALHDITTKRAITPTGIGRIPVLAFLIRASKIGDPMAQMTMLRKGIEKGIINPKRVTENIPVSQSIIGGRTISKVKALSHLLKRGK